MASVWLPLDKIQRLDIINVPGGLTPAQVKAKYPTADVIATLAMFDTDSQLNFVRIKDEGVKDGYLGSSKGIGIRGDKDLSWITFQEAYADPDIRDFVVGFPSLGENGQVKIDWGNKYSWYIAQKHKRMLIGYNRYMLILCATDNAMYLEDAAKTMIGFGCQFIINGDGGLWSPHLQRGSTIYRQGHRKNTSWLLVYLDKLQEFTRIVYDQIGKDYIYGADGQVFTPSMLKQFISWLGIKHYKTAAFDATKNAENDVQDFDCSGLFVYALRELGLITQKQDYTAFGLYTELCNKIGRSDLRNGDLVFRGSPIGHVGMYYNGQVLHAKGTAYGVVLNNELDTFHRYGRLKYFV